MVLRWRFSEFNIILRRYGDSEFLYEYKLVQNARKLVAASNENSCQPDNIKRVA